MTGLRLLMFFFAISAAGWSSVDAEDVSVPSGAISGATRDRRHLIKKRLCKKYGVCQQGGFQGGSGGFQGGYPPINIAVSQSQSAANGAGGGYSNGYYPNNLQYNGGYPGNYGGYPNQGYYGGYPNQGGYGGYPQQGGYGPGSYENGQNSFNNQFNGNYYGPGAGGPQGGGYGFRPSGPYYDENPEEDSGYNHEEHDEQDDSTAGSGAYNGYNQGPGYQNEGQNFAAAGAFAVAGRKSN